MAHTVRNHLPSVKQTGSIVEEFTGPETQPNRDEATSQTKRHIGGDESPLVLTGQLKRLQAEG